MVLDREIGGIIQVSICNQNKETIKISSACNFLTSHFNFKMEEPLRQLYLS